ncbi:hypothetical protein N658DRAFT_415070 [Parathielavia hyrcaniae]|uniref:Xylanolytic transcriptional activator regulatory domain-containing protein n=1 Tax=Parathielavia hyrcaniae TaxID=113614 RepID=A0AAN6QAU2_9PEZI|nr:hypothetical protein N658DRAFT_415070 [Parathielavia hyrcaniae]
MQSWDQVRQSEQEPEDSPMAALPTMPAQQQPLPVPVPVNVRHGSYRGLRKLPSRGNANGLSEETNIYTETRMLQDQTGRLLYIGDASTLSILQLIRIVVENTAGSDMGSPFIDDPKRHRILESIVVFPPNVRIPCPIPDRGTADVLITSCFTNTCGLIEVLDRPSFLRSVDEYYRDPPSASSYFVCHLYLVLALGLLLAAPVPGSHEEAVVQKQLSAQPDRGELFFRSARSMCDPGAGFEDADFWSIQALALMTIYMLIVSKRNTAYAYLGKQPCLWNANLIPGMAVRSAYALGLHREETMRDVIFTPTEMRVRRNLWKTLFILDRFLAATLGRPTAISEDDCSCKILPDKGATDIQPRCEPGLDPIHASSLDSCVEAAHVIGVTLKVFSRRKISTAKVQEIVDMSKNWDLASPSYRRRSSGGPINPAHGMASLHVSLLSLHSLILLTRQLFVMHNWMLVEERSGIKKAPQIRESPMARFSEACVVASYRTIKLARSAREDGYLPRRNPFIIYFVFAASLVILMNQFSSLYSTDEYHKTMRDATDIVTYCAEIDPQARRVLDIITRFSEVVSKWTKDHAYPAPQLSADFRCLYAQPTRPGPASEHMHPGSAVNLGTQRKSSSQAVNGPDPGLLTPPPLSKLSHLDILHNQVHSGPLEARVHPMTPLHANAHGSVVSLVAGRPSISAQSSISSEPLSGNIEFEFDGLWNSFINHLPPVSSVAPGINNLALQFPPPVIGAPTEPYGAYLIPKELKSCHAGWKRRHIPFRHN